MKKNWKHVMNFSSSGIWRTVEIIQCKFLVVSKFLCGTYMMWVCDPVFWIRMFKNKFLNKTSTKFVSIWMYCWLIYDWVSKWYNMYIYIKNIYIYVSIYILSNELWIGYITLLAFILRIKRKQTAPLYSPFDLYKGTKDLFTHWTMNLSDNSQ